MLVDRNLAPRFCEVDNYVPMISDDPPKQCLTPYSSAAVYIASARPATSDGIDDPAELTPSRRDELRKQASSVEHFMLHMPYNFSGDCRRAKTRFQHY